VEIRLAEAGEYLRIRAEEVAALSEEVKSLKEALAAEKAARVAADTDIVQLRADLVTERVSLESTLAANVAMKERFDTTTRELGDAREDLRVAGVQAQKSLETITTLESQAARLRGEARNREAKCVALADQVARLERQIAQERGVVTNDEFAAAQRHHLELEAVRHQLQQEKEAELAHAQRQVKFMQAQMQQQKRAFELANSSTATKAEKDELALRAQLLEREERQLEVQRALDLERVHAAQVCLFLCLHIANQCLQLIEMIFSVGGANGCITRSCTVAA
jgi:chromosome segregation ATPase